ncbi:hypothetical protein [Maribacter sp. ACAM166]|uniref:hypothetical protein n=1 Tax=Maribacter sp. ACAM166 TaxID=2508996 RepID=UPI0010FE39BD|nr:hypothetical protein [Maribacter sp. ACAM166]TLP81378.1 hypothetical protein ES765_05055 [Maribacter sp. ACAM166]
MANNNEQLTTYTVKAKHRPDVWVFKYHLNGVLKSFEVLDGIMEPKQINWLFNNGNFPYMEATAKELSKIRNKEKQLVFDVAVGLPLLTFQAFWDAYGHKRKITRSKLLWAKLNDATKLKAIDYISRYNNYLRNHNGIAKCNPDTYLHQRQWEDEE